MRNISTLIGFISIILLMGSCTSRSYMLTDRDLANDGVQVMEKPSDSNFRMVANKPTMAANADAKWIAAARPHIVASSNRISKVDAVALSAATTVEGHEILKREIEKAMKSSKSEPTSTMKVKNKKKANNAESKILL